MKTQFEKIYVITLINNKGRQKFIKQQFDLLGLDFEFIYGIDFSRFEKDYFKKQINYPVVLSGDKERYKIARDYGCALNHFIGVNYAYEFDYNNVLIIEDDICFLKNPSLIEYYLNNIPQDADFITFDLRFISYYENEIEFLKKIKRSQDKYIEMPNNIWNIGGMMYGIMNRKSMKIYLNNQTKIMKLSDHVDGFWDNPILKRYVSKDCICTDIFNTTNNFKKPKYDKSYTNIYSFINKNLASGMFFNCFYNTDAFTRW